MPLRMTKGVGMALALAASCAVLGVVMAPGWYAFAAFGAWWAFVLALGGQTANESLEPSIQTRTDTSFGSLDQEGPDNRWRHING